MSDVQIHVLVADDSQMARVLLAHLLNSDSSIHVAGTVGDGQAAIDFLKENRVDVIVMDIHMPRLDGFEATRQIMETQPVPIVICSSTTNPRDVATTFRLLEAGAVACVEKPVGPEHPDFESLSANLLRMVKLMSEVKVVRRWPRTRAWSVESPAAPASLASAGDGIQVVGIGASTGGPPVLQTILSSLPKDFSVPILIVQHIAHGFLAGLAEWLNQTTGWRVQIASHGAIPLAGHVYLAPDDFHMGLSSSGRILLSHEEPLAGLRPAVGYLFRTLAAVRGPRAVGVLLTGMGRDGAAELKLMRDAGAETIVQDRETSVVHGMPGEAIALGAAERVLSPERIAEALIALARRRGADQPISS